MLVYALVTFLGALLLFQVQPLMGKLILPWYGGGPAVWTTCMLFFQVLLLAGYGYAHLVAMRLRPRAQAVVHVVLLVAAAAALPILPGSRWKPGSLADPTWHILALLAASVGLPYLVLSTTAPLVQAWFSRTHPGRSPYRLYALSNAGSLLALLSYPFIVEPILGVRRQAMGWSGAFAVYALLMGWCVLRTWRQPEMPATAASEAQEERGAPSLVQRCLWIALSACGSVLLLAVTNQLCADVAVVPFLWVLPLSLYLLTFILAFHSARCYPRVVLGFSLPIVLAWMLWLMFEDVDVGLGWQVLGYSVGLFVCCMVCHGELVRLKPSPRHLTSFYLLVASGGALGGVLVTLVAPRVFPAYFELHVGLLACGALALGAWWYNSGERTRWHGWRTAALSFASVAALAGLAVALAAEVHRTVDGCESVSRNFYGVLRVESYLTGDPDTAYTALVHGRISHGNQFQSDEGRWLPTTYYGEQSGVGLALGELVRAEGRRIGVVGLGVGTLAVYGRPGDRLRFYEINPEVRRLATSRFTYLADSAAEWHIEMGDARLSLERELARREPQHFDLLALDAFTSDAIPIHLLTREAFAVYLRHLRPDGVLAVHTSNRYLDLVPVLLAHADHFGLAAAVIDSDEDEIMLIDAATWVLLSRDSELLESGDLGAAAAGTVSERRCHWTDDFSDLLEVLD